MPNPARGRVSFAHGLAGAGATAVSVYDAGGRLVLTDISSGPQVEVDTRSLGAGTYRIVVRRGSHTATQSLVVPR